MIEVLATPLNRKVTMCHCTQIPRHKDRCVGKVLGRTYVRIGLPVNQSSPASTQQGSEVECRFSRIAPREPKQGGG